MQSQEDLIRIIESMNDYASTYHASVEESSHIFLSGSDKQLSPAVVDYLKKTNCTNVISNEEWTKQLSEAGYPLKDIRPFDNIILNADYPPLTDLIRDYIKNPQHRRHSLYQAIQHAIKSYQINPKFDETIEALASIYKIPPEKAEQWFKEAYTNQETLTPLSSYLKMLANEFNISNPLYFQAAKLMNNENERLGQKWPVDKSNISEYFKDKTEKLIQLASQQDDLTPFYAELNAELLLFDLCGTDYHQIKKTLAFLSNNPLQETEAYRTLAGIQKIQQLAQKLQNITYENYFDGHAEASTWQTILPLFKGSYRYQFTIDALQDKLPPPQKAESFEIFPGVTLISVLEKGESQDENKPMHAILTDAIKRQGTLENNQVILDNISRIYQLDRSKVNAVFSHALQKPSLPKQDLENELIQSYAQSKLDLSAPLKQLDILQQQLMLLLADNTEILSYMLTHMENQKQTLLELAKTGDPVALKTFSDHINIVQTLGEFVANHETLRNPLKTMGKSRDIILLSECLNDLKKESPEKVAAIQSALTVVLNQTPDITFKTIALAMRDPTLDKNSPIGQLKNTMGAHRNIILWFFSLFYPIETKTTTFFREKMLEQKYTNKDLGQEPVEPPQPKSPNNN